LTFDQQYIKALEKVYDLTKEGRTEEISNDFSIPKMFGAWSSIFWALPQLDKFDEFNLEDLKKLVQALIKSHCGYKSTTNQLLRTDTIEWIAGKLAITVNVYGTDQNERLYAEWWISELFKNSETEYNYSPEIGLSLKKEKEVKIKITAKIEQDKTEKLDKIELEIEKRKAEKRKIYFEHLERNQIQKEKRDEYLREFEKLSLVEKLRRVINDDKPLFFFPTTISELDESTILELTSNERTRLTKKILKYRMKEWYKTNEMIKQLGKQ